MKVKLQFLECWLWEYDLVLLCLRVLSRGSKLLSLWTFPQALQPGAGGKGKSPTERIILQVLSFALFLCISSQLLFTDIDWHFNIIVWPCTGWFPQSSGGRALCWSSGERLPRPSVPRASWSRRSKWDRKAVCTSVCFWVRLHPKKTSWNKVDLHFMKEIPVLAKRVMVRF